MIIEIKVLLKLTEDIKQIELDNMRFSEDYKGTKGY